MYECQICTIIGYFIFIAGSTFAAFYINLAFVTLIIIVVVVVVVTLISCLVGGLVVETRVV